VTKSGKPDLVGRDKAVCGVSLNLAPMGRRPGQGYFLRRGPPLLARHLPGIEPEEGDAVAHGL
jgi:hypothetical protein